MIDVQVITAMAVSSHVRVIIVTKVVVKNVTLISLKNGIIHCALKYPFGERVL